jgi:surfeit locus 1 family protein
VEFSRSGVLASVAILVVVAVCVRLGFWQLDRRAQRVERNAAIAERLAAGPVSLTTLPRDTAGLLHRSVTLRGELDHARSLLLIGRSHLGAPGVHLFTPLRMPQGAILVNRGWLPAPDAASVDLDRVAHPAGEEVTGVVMAFPDVRGPPAGEGFQTRWHRLDGDAIRAQYPYEVATVYVQATARSGRHDAATAGPAAGRLEPVPLGPPALDAGPHLSYAVQWFSFAVIFLGGWIALVARRRPDRRAGQA